MKKRDDIQRNFTELQVVNAKKQAFSIVSVMDKYPDVSKLLDSDSLDEVEKGIKFLNDVSNGAWLLSSILLYQLVYDKKLFSQSNMTWDDYIFNSKKRLGMSRLDVSRYLTAAKFYIEFNEGLKKRNYQPRAIASLSMGYAALKATGNDVEAVLDHIVSDSVHEFEEWFRSFKSAKKLDDNGEVIRDDIIVSEDSVFIDGQSLFTMDDDVPEDEKNQFLSLITQVYKAVKDGYEPAIIPVNDENEAKTLIKLRDKDRQNR